MRAYGLDFPTNDMMQVELAFIRAGGYCEIQGVKFGQGLLHHVIAFQKLVWPEKKFHRWNEGLILPELCTGRVTAIYGAASTGKTNEAGDFMLTMYWAFPDEFTGLCSTTSLEKLDLRVFGHIKKQFRIAKEQYPDLAGYVIDSMRSIVTEEKGIEGRDFRNGIKGVATNKGGVFQGLSDYAGIKNKFVMLVADEAQMMESGFLQGAANLKSNPRFQGIYLGNMSDLITPLGDIAEPEHGWDTIDDAEKSRLYKTKQGTAIQLIGTDSPNLDYEIEPYPFLIGRRYLRDMANDYGEGSPMYEIMAKGKIPRGTMTQRVLTKATCERHRAFDPVTWKGEVKTLYAADLNYTFDHGDRTVGMHLGFGMDVEGGMRLALMSRPKLFAPTDKSLGSYEEQLARMIKAECEAVGVPPERFFYDGTGKSSFTSAIMRLWSTSVNPVEFGGKASDRPNFLGRKWRGGKDDGGLMLCRDLFEKFVSELWFAVTALVESDQARNLSETAIKEFEMRVWWLRGQKQEVEPKSDMKKRLGRSPDEADCLAVGVEGARRLGFTLGKMEPKNPKRFLWLKKMQEQYRERLDSKRLSVT